VGWHPVCLGVGGNLGTYRRWRARDRNLRPMADARTAVQHAAFVAAAQSKFSCSILLHHHQRPRRKSPLQVAEAAPHR
jgi:hypothetical protein